MTATQIIILVFTVLAGIVDIYLYLKDGDEATISRTLLKLSKDWPLIPLLFGLIIGHIFWSNCGVDLCPK